jgi:uncharacterized repeat protein (TIGR01451 family)
VLALVIGASGLVGTPQPASANDIPMGVLFSASMTGDVIWIGNANLRCNPAWNQAGQDCVGMQNGTVAGQYNDDYYMTHVDVDGDAATTKNSSSANLALPAGATVSKAFLYWSGTILPNSNSRPTLQGRTPKSIAGEGMVRGTVKIKVPGGAYQNITIPSASCGDNTDKVTESQYYQCYLDVTSTVVAGGSGDYWVGDVATGVGGNAAAGWALAVVTNDPAKPLNRVVVYGGSVTVAATSAGVTATINGFRTGPSSRLAKLGFFVLEGDRNITGDYVQVDGKTLCNNLNSSTNAMNGSISTGPAGTVALPCPTTASAASFARNPAATVDAMGIDIDVMGATIPQGAVSTSFTFGTAGDQYLISGISMVFALPTAFPGLTITKTATYDDTTTSPGSTAHFTIPVQNWGDDSASNVIVRDVLPAGVTYVPGTFKINGALVQDAAGGVPVGDIHGTVDRSSGTILYARVGTGATATLGGKVAECVAVLPCINPPTIATLTFDVVVDEPFDLVNLGQTLVNKGIVRYDADTSLLTNLESVTRTWTSVVAIGNPWVTGSVFQDLLLPVNGLWDKSPGAPLVPEPGVAGVVVRLTGGGVNLTTSTDANGNYAFKRVATTTSGPFTVTFDWSGFGIRVATIPNVGSDPSKNSKVALNGNSIVGLSSALGVWSRYETLGLRMPNPVSVCIAVTPVQNSTCQDWRWATP